MSIVAGISSKIELDVLNNVIVDKTKDFATRLFFGASIGTTLLAIKKTNDSSSLEDVNCFTLKNVIIYTSIGYVASHAVPKIYSYFFGNSDFEKSELKGS